MDVKDPEQAERAERRHYDSVIAALSRWAKEPDRLAALTKTHQAAADALTARLEKQVDPDGRLDPATRNRLVATARKLHFAKLGRKSAEARRARRRAEQLEAEVRDALLPLVASPDAAADAA